MGAVWDLMWILIRKVGIDMGSPRKSLKEADDRENSAWKNNKRNPEPNVWDRRALV